MSRHCLPVSTWMGTTARLYRVGHDKFNPDGHDKFSRVDREQIVDVSVPQVRVEVVGVDFPVPQILEALLMDAMWCPQNRVSGRVVEQGVGGTGVDLNSEEIRVGFQVLLVSSAAGVQLHNTKGQFSCRSLGASCC